MCVCVYIYIYIYIQIKTVCPFTNVKQQNGEIPTTWISEDAYVGQKTFFIYNKKEHEHEQANGSFQSLLKPQIFE